MPTPLTPAELLITARRRLDLTQKQVADRLVMSVSKYKRLEGEGAKDVARVEPDARVLLPEAFLGSEGDQLSPHEWCFIQRRRAGLSQAEVAKALGCCREWVQQMERSEADPGRLYRFWEGRVGG